MQDITKEILKTIVKKAGVTVSEKELDYVLGKYEIEHSKVSKEASVLYDLIAAKDKISKDEIIIVRSGSKMKMFTSRAEALKELLYGEISETPVPDIHIISEGQMIQIYEDYDSITHVETIH